MVFIDTIVYFFILKEVRKNESSSKQKQEQQKKNSRGESCWITEDRFRCQVSTISNLRSSGLMGVVS